jgi:hypothetical protein
MTKTPAEKREYIRGYNRGRSRALGWAQAAIKIGKAYRARSTDERAERLCGTCSRWSRGCPKCVWGRCAADFERGIEPAMWPETPLSTPRRDDLEIITTEDFGCTCWLPKQETRP